MIISESIRDHQKRLGLINFEVRESLGGWQAIAKYRDAITGPWGVGCDPDMVIAMEKALVAGEHEMTVMKRDQGLTTWTPEMERMSKTLGAINEFDDLLGES